MSEIPNPTQDTVRRPRKPGLASGPDTTPPQDASPYEEYPPAPAGAERVASIPAIPRRARRESMLDWFSRARGVLLALLAAAGVLVAFRAGEQNSANPRPLTRATPKTEHPRARRHRPQAHRRMPHHREPSRRPGAHPRVQRPQASRVIEQVATPTPSPTPPQGGSEVQGGGGPFSP